MLPQSRSQKQFRDSFRFQLSSPFWCSERQQRSDGQMIAARTRSGLSKCQWQRINLIQLVISAFFYFRYGDKTPRSLLARLFAIVWMVSGIILLSMFTAQVSSRLTAQELRSDHHLFGKKVDRIFPFFSFFFSEYIAWLLTWFTIVCNGVKKKKRQKDTMWCLSHYILTFASGCCKASMRLMLCCCSLELSAAILL